MKFYHVILCLGLASCQVFRTTPSKNIIKNFENENGKVMIAAHRANLIDTLPENSMEAIMACIDHNIDIIEIDLQRTKDDVLVLMHDDRIDRMCNGKGLVSDFTWEEIQQFNLRSRSFGPHTDYKIPSFEQVLDSCKGKIMINVDKAFWYLDKVTLLAADRNMNEQLILKNYDSKDKVDSVLSALPFTFFMPIISEVKFNNITNQSDFINSIKSFVPECFELIFDSMDDFIIQPENIKTLHSKGSRVWINSLSDGLCGGYGDDKNSEENWQTLIDRGANIIQTDRGLHLQDYLKKTNQ